MDCRLYLPLGAGDITGIVLLALALCLQLGFLCYSLTRKTRKYNLLIISFMWLVSLILYCLLYFLPLPKVDFARFSGFAFAFINLSTIIPVLHTILFVLSIVDASKLMKVFLFFCVIAIHVGLAGSLYIEYWYETGNLRTVYTSWHFYYQFWILFGFIVGIIPVFMGILHILRTNEKSSVSRFESFMLVLKFYPFSAPLLLYMVLIMVYIGISMFLYLAIPFGPRDDGNWQNFYVEIILVFIYTFLHFIQWLLMQSMKDMTMNLMKFPTSLEDDIRTEGSWVEGQIH
jgi:hypothetical protein